MSHHTLVRNKRTLHISPTCEEFGFEPLRAQTASEEKRERTKEPAKEKSAATQVEINHTANQILANIQTAANIKTLQLRNNSLLELRLHEMPMGHYRELIEHNEMISKVMLTTGDELVIIFKDEREAFRVYRRILALWKEMQKLTAEPKKTPPPKETGNAGGAKRTADRDSLKQKKNGFLREEEQKALSTAATTKARCEILASAILRSAGGGGAIDQGSRNGEKIQLKLKEKQKWTGDVRDLKIDMIRSCEITTAPDKKKLLTLTVRNREEAYELFDVLCRKGNITTPAITAWGMLLGLLIAAVVFQLAGFGGALIGFFAGGVVGIGLLSVVQRVAPVYAAAGVVVAMLTGQAAGIAMLVGVFFGYWVFFGIIELIVRRKVRKH